MVGKLKCEDQQWKVLGLLILALQTVSCLTGEWWDGRPYLHPRT